MTLSLVSLVLFAVFEMLTGAMQVSKFSHDKDEMIAASLSSMDRLTSELREANAVVFPSVSDGVGAEVTFRKVDPTSTIRFQEVVPPPLASQVWDPYNPAWTLQVRYYLANQRLLRAVGPVGGPPTFTSALASNVAGFNIQQDFKGTFTVGLVVRFQGFPTTMRRGVVVCPCLE